MDPGIDRWADGSQTPNAGSEIAPAKLARCSYQELVLGGSPRPHLTAGNRPAPNTGVRPARAQTIPMKIAPSLLDAGASCRSDEELTAYLKQAGLSKLLSVLAFSHIAGVPVGDAKRAIHVSDAWSGSRARDEEFHDALVRGLDQI